MEGKEKTHKLLATEHATPLGYQSAGFPIVGIGASAGGLEALDLFFTNVPVASGIAFVIVQHLDPTHKGLLVELLQRNTPMIVVQVRDRTRVKPNWVYVIPPNKDMSILHGVLHLLDPIAPRGLRLPIDFFLRSLAVDQQEKSIGVILSGMGSDGTLGARAIKEKEGVVFVQEPASAKFDAMPRSAIDAGLADGVAPVEALPGKIVDYLKHAPLITKSGLLVDNKVQSSLEKVIILLRSQTGHDFSLYKRTTIYRRIERRMGIHQIDKITDYVRYLQENPQEVELLFNELLIGVTSFFRDPSAWETLKAKVLPALIVGRTAEQPLRAWVPGCATGEEAYSLAMIFKEATEAQNPTNGARNLNLQIFATDLDQQAISKAREGIFPANITADVLPERLNRFFVPVENGYQVIKPIREMVVFAPQDLIMDPPFTKLDLLCCRNLLIYLTSEIQKKLLPLFHYCLNPGGILFLGNAETIGSYADLFTPLAGKDRLYRRQDSSQPTETVEFPGAFSSRPKLLSQELKPLVNLQNYAEQLLLQGYSPAAVLTDSLGNILFVNGHTGSYLEPTTGKANWNIFVMAREGLRYELSNAFQQVKRQNETVTFTHRVAAKNGERQRVEVTLQPVQQPDSLKGMVMIVFKDLPASPELKAAGLPIEAVPQNSREQALEKELELTRLEVMTTREAMQTSQEELKSTNEELQSTNEELQSTNEELTTSKEEMQSMNEEMQTVNSELQAKVEELSRANNDLKNLFDSTSSAALFLDNALRVQRFTHATSKITSLIPGDVGRPITDIASTLLYPGLVEDAHQVLDTLIRVERQIKLADGDWFGISILPYRTNDNRIEGVVITFTDITAYKKLEMELRGKNLPE